jgi:hypothetical protein
MIEEVLPHQSKYFADQWIAQAVEDLIAIFTRLDDMFAPQYGEMLGCVRLLDSYFFAEVPNRDFAVTKMLDNCDSGGMSQGLENLRLKLA